eukprot:TRINITY_DN3211_c0_g1_i1.p1 TRINITY_DN3211_c0_g1~~TRINITY_DN3211_c0_g1_i1.p1  ORF type:complete len:159 (+),score=55.85 TRINITY_DN3211_c0_g1_i1:147-623(+)
MLGRNKPVYQPTTYSVSNGGGNKRSTSSYLPSGQGAFCGGKKRRLQLLFLSFGVVLILLGVLTLGASISGALSSTPLLIGSLLLAVFLILLGAWMVILYLRTRGKCNFSFWPNRAAVLSAHLTDSSSPVAQPRGSIEEESSLMPSSSSSDAPKIVPSA